MSSCPLTPIRLQELFEAIEPVNQPLAGALGAWHTGDCGGAVRMAAAYFRRRLVACGSPLPLDDAVRVRAQDAVAGRVTVVFIPHAFADGRIDWRFDATSLPGCAQDHEWVWQLNRMTFWPAMAAVYDATGDERYPAAFAEQLRSWVDSWDIPQDSGNYPDSGWRTIECGLRLMSYWPRSMAVMARSASVTDDDILLYLWTSLKQMRHLMTYHRPGSNWLTMEMNGIYTFASDFPEFRDSAHARHEAMTLLHDDIGKQLLPDGGQWELTPSYHLLSINCSLSLILAAQRNGFLAEVPPDFLSLLEKGYAYLVNIMTPERSMPHPNDSGDNQKLPCVCQKFGTLFPDNAVIQWCARGASVEDGSCPPYTSLLLPWSGYCVMRSSWGTDAAYCLFDVGFMGYGHYHQDKLNLAINYLGEELLFDDGGGNYECSGFRSYACSAWDHSVVAVDGMGQWRDSVKERLRLGTPVDAVFETTAEQDYAEAVYDQGFGLDMKPLAVHRRQVLFVKPDIFLVCDRLTPLDDQEHRYEARWQVDSLKMRQLLPGVFMSERGKHAELVVAPLLQDGLSCKWQSDVIGDGDSGKAGLYISLNPRPYRPAVTVSHARIGCGEQVFLTLLYPVSSADAEPIRDIRTASAGVFLVHLSDGRCLEVTLAERPSAKSI